MTDKKVVVKVDHVGKYFRLPTESTQSLRTALVNRFKGIKGYKEQHVLKDISFEVHEGDFFGVVGRNGSGKSTLLKIMSQIYVPETGSVTVDGKLVSFIELGVGFNPELTGRENVYMNGAMLGFTREEIDAMYDDIVDFAELREFMNQKLKNYSSGMQVRLAFSVAIKAQGDILILDEVLAVGDEAFQRKCNDYFMERKKSGKTTILVTHDMSAVKKYCNRAVLVEHGLIKVEGDPFDVTNQYSVDNLLIQPQEEEEEEEIVQEEQVPLVSDLKATLLTNPIVSPDDEVIVEFTYKQLIDGETHLAFTFFDVDSHFPLYNDNSLYSPAVDQGEKHFRYTCRLPYLNKAKLRLIAVVKDSELNILAHTEKEESPVIIVQRQVDPTDLSEVDSADGMLLRQGTFYAVSTEEKI